MINCNVLSIFLYDSECWTVTSQKKIRKQKDAANTMDTTCAQQGSFEKTEEKILLFLVSDRMRV